MYCDPFYFIFQKCSPDRRPVWWVFAGMGTQWPQMGRKMMTIDAFRQSIQRSETVLSPYGIQLADIILKGADDVFDSTILSFVGIAAIQVSIVFHLEMSWHGNGSVFLALCEGRESTSDQRVPSERPNNAEL